MTLRLDYDRDYGIDHRRGWSVAIDGSYYVQFWPEPITAVIVALWRWWQEAGA